MKAYLLLDRSGSMETMWSEALGSINGYVAGLDDRSIEVTLACFDTLGYQILREDARAGDWKKVTSDEVTARGGTPLYDAAGKLLDTMFKDDPRKAVLVVMTDGYENASKEYTREAIKKKIARAVENGWSVVFLGANFDKIDTVSSSVGVGWSNTIFTTAYNLENTMTNLAAKTSAYAAGSSSTVEFTAEDKKKAADTTKQKGARSN